jgi:hypothetical protein
MRRHIARVVVIAGILLSACGGASQDQDSESAAERDSITSQTSARADTDTTSAHSGHQVPGDSASPAASHSGHQGAQASTAASVSHGGHAVAGRTPSSAHSQHEPAATSHTTHAASASARPDAAHAMHTPARPDSAHAGHTVAKPDSSHAAHVSPRPDSSHAMHTPARADTSHAGHVTQQAADTAHAAHGVPSANEHAQHGAAPPGSAIQGMTQPMWMRPLGRGWTVMGMAQAYPIASTSLSGDEGSSLDATEFYLTQPAVMFNIESAGSRFTLRTTLNFEGVTQENGELTFGGWGEGFIDKRHPHTLLHEFMLSANLWSFAGGDVSISAGKGFAPYGTDDPMSRPVVKYPTNHHLSQILERWTLNGVYVNRGWSVEAGLFGGGEPEGPYDLSNIESFGDSWSARVARRFGPGYGPMAETELSASFGRVREVQHEEAVVTKLYNAALRHERVYGFGNVYGLLEASKSELQEGDGYFSILAETQLRRGAHQPYYRVEYATRPEYEREGVSGTDDFFRYDHDSHAIGATRWLINTVGYGYELTGYPISARPFVELQHNRARAERGGIEPEDLFGKSNFWGVSAGFRVFLGGDPMRMGSYGVLDPMTSMHRGGAAGGAHTGHQ